MTREGGNFQSKNLDSSVLVPCVPDPPLRRIGKRPNWPRKACKIKSLESLVWVRVTVQKLPTGLLVIWFALGVKRGV